jgi:hypothetical protein
LDFPQEINNGARQTMEGLSSSNTAMAMFNGSPGCLFLQIFIFGGAFVLDRC